MLFTDEYVAVCQPRTGSTMRRHVFSKILRAPPLLQAADGREIHGHMPFREVPEDLREGRAGLATVRDPFSWLVSVYSRLRDFPPGPTLEMLRKWGGGSEAWEHVLYGWTHPWEVLPDLPRHTWTNPGAPDWSEQRVGLWSVSVRWYYEGCEVFVDSARQNRGWALLFPDYREAFLDAGRLNGFEHKPVRDMFTPEQAEWVRQADRTLMKKLGYGGVGHASTQLVGHFPQF